jgi:hypothetical protein
MLPKDGEPVFYKFGKALERETRHMKPDDLIYTNESDRLKKQKKQSLSLIEK